MVNPITKEDLQQDKYLKVLERVNSKLFPEINIKQGLFNETWYCQKFTKQQVFRLVIKSLFTKQYILKTNISGNDILTFYTKNYRADHDYYWTCILEDVGKHDEIEALSNVENKLQRLDLISLPLRLIWLVMSIWDLRKIDSVKDRWYLATQMVHRKYTIEKIRKMNLHPKVVMCFFDSAPEESFVMQYFKNNGARTITNQHGQSVFVSWDYDRLNQSQILNFKCDCYLAKGAMQQTQFERAGLNANIVKPIGILGEQHEGVKHHKLGCFGVYLDYPLLPFASRTNPMLINFAKKISKKTGLKYLIKAHPAEQYGKFDSLIDSNCVAIIYGKDIGLKETFKKIDFGIVHASATYIDVYFYGLRCFKYLSNVSYPIAFKEDEVCDVDKIVEKITKWNTASSHIQEEYIYEIRKQYDFGWKTGNIKQVLQELMA